MAAHTGAQIFQQITRVRKERPLVWNLVNFVAMNFNANALLALGASPLMSVAPEESADLAKIAHALVLNPGTLSREWERVAESALGAARARPIPVVLDPVGVGATHYRSEVSRRILERGGIQVLRGNASEILALHGELGGTELSGGRGVDSLARSETAIEAARALARHYGLTVGLSGETDYIVDASRTVALRNGHALMTAVTGMGCTLSALVGAFLAIESDAFRATLAAFAITGVAGERAAEGSSGPGTFEAAFRDDLFGLDEEDFCARLRMEAL